MGKERPETTGGANEATFSENKKHKVASAASLLSAVRLIGIALVLGAVVFAVQHFALNHIPQYDQAALSDHVNQLVMQKKYADALDLVDGQKYKTKEDLRYAQLLRAFIAQAKGDNVAAIEAYKKLEKDFGLTGSLAESIAEFYVGINDKKGAIVYYQKAHDLYLKETHNPVGQASADYCQKQIVRLTKEAS